VGSSNNYFTEFLILVLVAIPYLLKIGQTQQLHVSIFRHRLPVRTFTVIALFILVTSKTIGLFSAVYIEKGIKNNKEEYARDQQLLNYFRQTLKIKNGQNVFFTERRFLDNLFIEYAIMPVKDVVTYVYKADSTTFNYSRFTNGMNTGLVTYIVTDEKRNDINVCNDSLPFIFFGKTQFRLVARVSGYCIYKYGAI